MSWNYGAIWIQVAPPRKPTEFQIVNRYVGMCVCVLRCGLHNFGFIVNCVCNLWVENKKKKRKKNELLATFIRFYHDSVAWQYFSLSSFINEEKKISSLLFLSIVLHIITAFAIIVFLFVIIMFFVSVSTESKIVLIENVKLCFQALTRLAKPMATPAAAATQLLFFLY